MDILKLQFVDFWFGFEPENNYFFRLLSLKYVIQICDDPQLIIYSCYGKKHLTFDCTRVFYSAENVRPDFYGCDFAITFDYNEDLRHYRLPLYALYIDQPGLVEKLCEKKSREKAFEIWKRKTKFCCMVVSNGRSRERLRFFEKLTKYKIVDSGGKVMNNVGGPVKDKMAFISKYRFVIAFENSSWPGYVTEKIIEPFLADCIPIYWGDPLVNKSFNSSSFLDMSKVMSDEELIDRIIEIDTNQEKAIEMLMESNFRDGIIPAEIRKERLIQFFDSIISYTTNKIPVSKTWKQYIYKARVDAKKFRAIFNYYFNRLKMSIKIFA